MLARSLTKGTEVIKRHMVEKALGRPAACRPRGRPRSMSEINYLRPLVVAGEAGHDMLGGVGSGGNDAIHG